MIGELLSPDEAEHHLGIIKEHLQHPDGVRLMNRPAAYHGGVSTNFKRAEQAANFGREIGLQYVHAHIRFTEAMAKLGQKEETWHALGSSILFSCKNACQMQNCDKPMSISAALTAISKQGLKPKRILVNLEMEASV